MEEALAFFFDEENKLSVRKTALRFGISYTNFARRCKGGFVPKGPNTVLTEKEESDIVDWLLFVSSRGFPLSENELKDCVKTILDLQQRSTIFKHNRPGRSWCKSFLQRHRTLSIRLAENLNKSRASVTEEMIRSWFDEVNRTSYIS